jgi:GT2 family glycosyltransferase
MVADVKVSIIIVNHNGERFIEDCLNSIALRVTCDYEVILVDNASSDSSCSIVETKYPWVKIIRSNRNLGFAAGNNLGARRATGQYLLLLNNDTVLLSDLYPAIALLEANSNVGIVGANMLDEHGVSRPCSGAFPTPLRLLKFSSMFIMPGQHRRRIGKEAWIVDWVQGSFLLTTVENWTALGGLDESYFMYVEDVDFCKRTQLRGLLCAYYPLLGYIHYGGYGAVRWHLLYSGHKRYQKKFHGGIVANCAVFVLRSGSIARLLVLACRRMIRGRSARDNRELEGLLNSFRNP